MKFRFVLFMLFSLQLTTLQASSKSAEVPTSPGASVPRVVRTSAALQEFFKRQGFSVISCEGDVVTGLKAFVCPATTECIHQLFVAAQFVGLTINPTRSTIEIKLDMSGSLKVVQTCRFEVSRPMEMSHLECPISYTERAEVPCNSTDEELQKVLSEQEAKIKDKSFLSHEIATSRLGMMQENRLAMQTLVTILSRRCTNE